MACNSAVMLDMDVIPSEKSATFQARKFSPELLFTKPHTPFTYTAVIEGQQP